MRSIQLYNPKAHAPAVYIPAWLSQVPSRELKPNCKLVYGRLAQWATAQGRAHRSAEQLSQELGMPHRTVQECIKELKAVRLIGSHQEKEGGHNHFEFYHHPWMDEQINKNLCYKSDSFTPPANLAVQNEPYAESAHPYAESAHPYAESAQHKIKRNKNKINNNNIPDFEKSGTESQNNDLKKQEPPKPRTKTKTDYKKDSRFMRFYNAYPKKVDPHDAYKAFKSMIGNDDELLEKVLADIEARKESHSQWQDRRFIKYPAVYLRKGEYDSEIINDRLEAEQKREKEKAIKDAENKAREEAQERLTKERQEAERKNNLNKQADAASYRKTVKEIPKGLESLKHSIRKWG